MSLLQTLITYKATVAVWGLLFTPAIGVAGYYEVHTDRGLFGLAPIPGPTVYVEPSAIPTVTATETQTMTASPSVSTIAQAPGPTVLPSPATTETLIVPLPVPFPTTATETATVTPSSTPSPSPTRTGHNHANGLVCFILVEVDHGNLLKHPCPEGR